MDPKLRIGWRVAWLSLRPLALVAGCAPLLLAQGWSLLAADELVLTVDASASGTAALAPVMSDNCSINFSARVVYRPDPTNGQFKVFEESYTATATGSGYVQPVSSWTYTARQPGPSSVALNLVYMDEGRAYVDIGYLSDFVNVSPAPSTENFALGFCKTAEDNWLVRPDAGLVTFPTNVTHFIAVGDAVGNDSNALGSGQFNAHYTLTRGEGEVEVVIIPPPDYDSWVPEGNADEAIMGPKPFLVSAELRIPGTQVSPPERKARFRFVMSDTSREPGSCLNTPPEDEASTSYDLQFSPSSGSTLSNERQQLETGDLATKASAAILCYDYGASSVLRVTAILDSGREVPAHVEGDTGKTSLAIPKDENNNHIADAWEKARGIFARNLPDNWDGDDSPSGQDSDGDGISLFEGYRGFFFGRNHERLEPGFKHVFVFDRDGYVLETMKSGQDGINFAAASKCRVRFVTDRTWTGHGSFSDKKRIVNFNHGRAHRVDQRAIEVQIVTETTPLDPEDWYEDLGRVLGSDAGERGRTEITTGGCAFNDLTCPGPHPKSPGNIFVIQVYPAHLNARITKAVEWNTQGLPAFAGYLNLPAADRAAKAEAFNAEVQRYIASNPDKYRDCWWKMVSRVVVHEMGHGVGIHDLKPSLSGPMECVIRYLSNKEIGIDPNDRFELRRRDPWPHIFCTSAEGSPVGKSCQQQIRITDER